MFKLYIKHLKSNQFKILVFITIILTFILVRSIDLGTDILNTDAERWYRRSSNFFIALKQQDFKNTYQMYHPGVSIMWLTSIVDFLNFQSQLLSVNTPLTLENSDFFIKIHFYTKFSQVLVLSILFSLQIFFINKLFNKKTSIVYSIFIIFEPYLIAINRWHHLTSFEVFFGFTSFLSFLYYIKNYNKKYLFLSAFLLAISILAKITSVIFGIIILLIFTQKLIISKNKFSVLKPLFIYGLIVFTTIFVLFPALWVDPMYVYNKMFSSVSTAITNNPREDYISGLKEYIFYIVTLAFKLSPVTLVLFLISIPYSFKSPNVYLKYSGFSLIIFYIFLTITDQKIDRYSLAFFLYIILIISNYVSHLKTKYICSLLSLVLIFYCYTFYVYHPVYSAYYSPLFYGTKSALNLGYYDNSGEYFAQAALYLKQKPRSTKVYVPNGYSSFNLYYNGITQRDFSHDTDYIVTSYDMQRLDPTINLKENCLTLEKSFGSKEHDIVFIYKCN